VNMAKHILISRRKVLQAGAAAAFTLAIGIVPGRIVNADTPSDASKNPDQLGFMHNQEKCIGCNACSNACKAANNWEEGTKWRRVLKAKQRKVYLSYSCNHCEDPACATVCPVKAYTKRAEDGIVVHDPEKCVGCKYCMYACPYHVPQFSPVTGRISKCHFCFERQEKGEQPACVSECPTQALTYGRVDILRQYFGATSQVEGMPNPELTKPSLIIIPKA